MPGHHNEQFTIRGPVKVLGQCGDTQGSSASEGAFIGVRTCNGSATQAWEYWW